MSEWIKPSDLPKDFWSECFVYFENEVISLPVYISMVRNLNHYNEEVLEVYSDVQRLWERLTDKEYRVIVIGKPNSPESIK